MSTSPFPPKPAKRSPFPDPSLRQAGESSRDVLLTFFADKLFLPSLYSIVFVAAALMEWFQYFTKRPPAPWLYTFIAVCLVAFTAWRFWRLKPEFERLALGVRGERHVGRMLDDLRRDDYRVYHDIPGRGDDGSTFNVDHLLIGPAGVFVIETKTHTKPSTAGGKRATVTYDGQRVLVDGHAPDRDPIAQAGALCDYIRDQLRKQTARTTDVRGVVLYPGWWVDDSNNGARIRLLNTKQLPAILRREPRRLSPSDIATFANAVEVAVRQAG